MSSSYIVEVWNKNGLYAGPGQVFAAHPRKAAITVMRNIGRPQLSAGGTTPYVIHVQDLDSVSNDSGTSSQSQGSTARKLNQIEQKIRGSNLSKRERRLL